MKTLLIYALLLLSAWAFAQDEFGPKGPVVTMTAAPVLAVTQGKTVTVPLTFNVAGGYHVNSNRPKSDYLIPTALKVEATTDIIIGKTTYPDGIDMSFPFA